MIAVLEPKADGFRNYLKTKYAVKAEESLVDRAQLLTLTAPEMTVLVGGMRVLKINFGGSQHGVFSKRPEALTNDFFVNLLDMSTTWKATAEDADVFEGRDREGGALKWTGTRVDLILVRTPSPGPWLRSTHVMTPRLPSSIFHRALYRGSQLILALPCTNQILLLYLFTVAYKKIIRGVKMMLRVQYQNYRYDYVDASTLDKLITRKGIRQFYRPAEERWVNVDSDPIRGLRGAFSGFDRRHPHMAI